MKKLSLFILFIIQVFFSHAHDDVAYLNSTGWHIDYENTGTIDRTLSYSSYTGNVATFFGDYNGDGYIDLCKVEANGNNLVWNWCLGNSSGNFNLSEPISIAFGLAASDKCIVGDFNGDGKTDIAVTRNSNNMMAWYIDYAPCDRFADISGQIFGLDGDIPLAGDFNADGFDDVCVFRPSEAKWYVSLSNMNGYPVFQGPYAINGLSFGINTDIPLIGDFNGDGYDDMAVFRNSDNKIYVNYFSPDKPKYEGYADLDCYGSIDRIITCTTENVIALCANDFNYSRPVMLPLATIEDLGKKVKLRHGWTCIFDESLNVDEWVDAWQKVGINTLEYHPWMRAHEEINPKGTSWNTYVGDDRLWTSKAKMHEKIQKFKAAGGRSIGYTGIYAAAPAFAYSHPDWAMRYVGSRNMITYGGTYLNVMAINENVNSNYTIDGKTFKNFNDYFVDQAIAAQTEFDWDGWRWDWYGSPGTYQCDGLNGTADFSYEVSVFTDRLNTAVKRIRPDVTTTTLQLPNANGNIPFIYTAAVVDHQFLELWPEAGGTGNKYSDLYSVIYNSKSRYPDKPLFANFYPPIAMNLKTSWTIENIRYQFATCLAAGGYPAAQVVDGIAGFTDPVPFHAVNYPVEVLTEISKWNRFSEAYGGYLYYSNQRYLIRDYKKHNVSANGSNAGFVLKAKERIDKKTRKTDLIIINLIDYGQTTELKWTEVNSMPASKSVSINVQLPEDLQAVKAYFLTPDSKKEISLANITDNSYQLSISDFCLFGTIVLTTNLCNELPIEPSEYATSFPDYKFDYDAKGETLNKEKKRITILDNQEPLVIENYYQGLVSTWETVTELSSQSVKAYPGKLYLTSDTDNAIRVPVNKFKKFKVAIKGNNANACWFGFRLLNPSTTSSIWQSQDIYYRIGGDYSDLPNIILNTETNNNDWVIYERNIFEDIKNHPSLTVFWQNAIITGIHLGPIDGGSAQYGTFEFMTDDYSGIDNAQEDDIRVHFNQKSKELEISSSIELKSISLVNGIGKTMLKKTTFTNFNLSGFTPGIYFLDILTDKGNIIKKIVI